MKKDSKKVEIKVPEREIEALRRIKQKIENYKSRQKKLYK